MKEFNEDEIKKDLKIDAHALDIPIGAAEIFIEKTINVKIKKRNCIIFSNVQFVQIK